MALTTTKISLSFSEQSHTELAEIYDTESERGVMSAERLGALGPCLLNGERRT